VNRGETFRFDANRHDGGAKTWLGHAIAPAGQQEGEDALDVLAMHPATARHVSRELARYFVSDDPPASLIDRMSEAFLRSDGKFASDRAAEASQSPLDMLTALSQDATATVTFPSAAPRKSRSTLPSLSRAWSSCTSRAMHDSSTFA